MTTTHDAIGHIGTATGTSTMGPHHTETSAPGYVQTYSLCSPESVGNRAVGIRLKCLLVYRPKPCNISPFGSLVFVINYLFSMMSVNLFECSPCMKDNVRRINYKVKFTVTLLKHFKWIWHWIHFSRYSQFRIQGGEIFFSSVWGFRNKQ